MEYRGEENGEVDKKLDQEFQNSVIEQAQKYHPHLLAMNERFMTDMHWDMKDPKKEYEPVKEPEAPPLVNVNVVSEDLPLRSSYMF